MSTDRTYKSSSCGRLVDFYLGATLWYNGMDGMGNEYYTGYLAGHRWDYRVSNYAFSMLRGYGQGFLIEKFRQWVMDGFAKLESLSHFWVPLPSNPSPPVTPPPPEEEPPTEFRAKPVKTYLESDVPKKDYPHKCPLCQEPAYVGLTRIDCSNEHCDNHPKT